MTPTKSSLGQMLADNAYTGVEADIAKLSKAAAGGTTLGGTLGVLAGRARPSAASCRG